MPRRGEEPAAASCISEASFRARTSLGGDANEGPRHTGNDRTLTYPAICVLVARIRRTENFSHITKITVT